ncbi:isopentenyl-diphosphate Delta-isomerase [Luteipulveratus sp. YIM 133132]|uniref:Isopentenyl-diphosphate Delta-isomerase n=1 Tax=Luteipulveratus flavus TaxID=3031728 RepID=A0ABT6CBR1_9MICO|nr:MULTISPECIES: isopentenyl-diphosphate Delta-isomerase [unclassified Luteipulveratus]MDE9365636.1 isopentenyl-diphosphate Delta-isomerase [Luteipulveratus sp. YIM 133132]MDF8266326.1 isopentenyl-diphosphate Delta-isomerase [Luteipulveratus sp. YIM 133296]
MTEEVVLLDDDGNAVGTAPKADVHHASTPLHLAFSLYLFGPDGAFLLTRRAETKRTFAGVWTNSVCGHPAPGEPMEDAVRRRAWQELGVRPTSLRLVLPRFSYRAEMDGVVEHEQCPVYAGWLPSHEISPDPEEVGEARWVPWSDFVDAVISGRQEVSAWSDAETRQLMVLGTDPQGWPAEDPALLPPAARDVDRSAR